MDLTSLQSRGAACRAQVKLWLAAIPSWRLRIYAAVLFLALGYFLWCRFAPSRELKPGQVTVAPQARKVAGMAQKTVIPQRLIVYVDKPQAIKRLGLPAEYAANPREELQTTAEVPRMKYGGTAAVLTNMSSGQSRTVIKANEAPWFRIERGNEIAGGYGIDTHDRQVAPIHYRRDLCQIKGAYLSGQVEANIGMGVDTQAEGKAMLMLNYRWGE